MVLEIKVDRLSKHKFYISNTTHFIKVGVTQTLPPTADYPKYFAKV